MHLIYVASARIPTEKAHGLQIMQMCAAFASRGLKVELWIPDRKNPIKENPFAYYGIETKFQFHIERFPIVESLGTAFGFFLFQFSFAFAMRNKLKNLPRDTVIYTRDVPASLFALWQGKSVFWEAHDISQSLMWMKPLLRRLHGVIAITNGLKQALVARGIPEAKIFVAPDGFNLDQFAKSRPKGPLSLSGRPVVLYAGSAQRWKGVFVLLEVAKELRGEAEFVFLLSGSDVEIRKFQKKAGNFPNVRIFTHVPHAEVPSWLTAARTEMFIAIPNSGEVEISRSYTSPLKMFEAMAAGRPIIASDLPALREILNERNSILVKPDSPAALAKGIRTLIEDTDLANRIADVAYEDSWQYAWDTRAEKILRWIKVKTGS